MTISDPYCEAGSGAAVRGREGSAVWPGTGRISWGERGQVTKLFINIPTFCTVGTGT